MGELVLTTGEAARAMALLYGDQGPPLESRLDVGLATASE